MRSVLIRMPFSPVALLALVFLLGLLVALVQIGLLTIAFDKLGLSAVSAYVLLFASLAGSAINLPLFSIRAERPIQQRPDFLRAFLRLPPLPPPDRTVIAINVGGCVIPAAFSFYLFAHHPLPVTDVLLAVAMVTAISRIASRPIPGLGIGLPILVAPLTAAFAALLLNPEQSAPLAYIAGTLGVLIGADLLRIRDIPSLGAPLAAIGGAGTFDGIFLAGLVAVLLA